MGMIKEFREFISRGSVVDLAVGVIIGAAFGKIINSLVSDIIMPPIGLMLNGVDFKNMKYIIKQPVSDGEKLTPGVSINYGMFIQNLVEFIIIAFVLFLIIRAINNMRRRQDTAPATVPPPPRQEVLLEEIRDLLRK